MNAKQSKQTQHTPGPWAWTEAYCTEDGRPTRTLVGDCGYGILSCDGELNSPQRTNTANARLIAAAPDLLNALTALANVAEARGIPVDAARAAIARATA